MDQFKIKTFCSLNESRDYILDISINEIKYHEKLDTVTFLSLDKKKHVGKGSVLILKCCHDTKILNN